jgi:4-carboxymuconolactone decarboxylase
MSTTPSHEPEGASQLGYDIMVSAEEGFRRLAIGDLTFLGAMANFGDRDVGRSPLDERTETLVQIAALVALDAQESSYAAAVESALLAGVTLDDLLATILGIAGSVGSARVVSAAPRIALAAGYDVDAALEQLDPPDR